MFVLQITTSDGRRHAPSERRDGDVVPNVSLFFCSNQMERCRVHDKDQEDFQGGQGPNSDIVSNLKRNKRNQSNPSEYSQVSIQFECSD